jgi:hypothetical protein
VTTAEEFLAEIEEYWGGKPMNDKARQITAEELNKSFGPDQWDPLFRAVVRSSGRFMPKLGEIITCAAENGIVKSEKTAKDFTTWKPTDCKLCQGEGLLNVVFRTELTKDRRRVKTFVSLQRHGIVGGALGDRENQYLFRCSCSAGDDERLCKSWPKWQRPEERPRAPRPSRQGGFMGASEAWSVGCGLVE